MRIFLAAALVFAGAAQAQTVVDFPEGATLSSAAEAKAYVEGKKFVVALANGVTLSYSYGTDGQFTTFITRPKGSVVTVRGTWTAEDGKICFKPVLDPANCADVRMHNNTLYYKRPVNGEVFPLKPS